VLGTRGVPARYGAYETTAQYLALLGGRGMVRWVIYCPKESAPPSSFGNAVIIPIKHGKGKTAPLFYDIRCLWDASRREDIDVIIMMGYGAGPFLLIPRFYGKLLITNTDGFEYRRSKWSLIIKLYFRMAEKFAAYLSHGLISDSIHILNYYKKRYRKESYFIAYGTEHPDYLILDKAKDRCQNFLQKYRLSLKGYHVVVMRLEPENSVQMICEAAVNRSNGKPILIIGPSTPYFDALFPRYATSTKLIYAGPIYDRPLLFLLRSNALSYIHGHTVGGINPTLVESLSTGTPVIARNTPFNMEVLEEDGLYFYDVESLQKQISFVESISMLEWENLAQKVRSRLRSNFTWNKVVEDYEKYVERVKNNT